MEPDNEAPDLLPFTGAAGPRPVEEAAEGDDGAVILPLPCPWCEGPRPPRPPAA
jgi:hypothetical protein